MQLWQNRSLEELQSEDERLDAEISVAQKRQILSELKKNGLTLQNVGGTFKSALNWLRSHVGARNGH